MYVRSENGEWSYAFHDIDGGYKRIDGHYSRVLVREGDTRKIPTSTYDEVVEY
jgi:hypothetical protein